MTENEVSGVVVDAALRVHVQLGPGLLESVYQGALSHELRKRGLDAQREVSVPVQYDGVVFEEGFRADLIVGDIVIVEVKSVERVAKVHFKQLLTYLRLTDKKLGLLLNFGSPLMKDGIYRVANGLDE